MNLRTLLRVRFPLKSAIYRQYSKASLNEALHAYKDIKFVPLRIKGFILGDSFSQASIDFTDYLEDSEGNIVETRSEARRHAKDGQLFTRSVQFGSLFYDGLDKLRQFTRDQGQRLKDEQINHVIQAFIYGFLEKKGFHEDCLQKILKVDREDIITVVLANHLLSKMTGALGKQYMVTDDHDWKFYTCPCECRCKEEIEYGNSGFGSEYMWYGKPDILLYPPGGSSVCVVLPRVELNRDSETPEDKQRLMEEVKVQSKDLRTKQNVRQFISQALTFSIYQKGYQKRHSLKSSESVSLIPTMAVSAESFDIYMYDAEHDILLRNEGGPIPLWKRMPDKRIGLNMSSVLQLWMFINHLTFKPRLTDAEVNQLSGSCNFLEQFSRNDMKTIESSVCMKARFNSLEEDDLCVTDLPCIPIVESGKN